MPINHAHKSIIMKNIISVLGGFFLVIIMFSGCEKEAAKEVIVHDTVYIDYDQFTYVSTGVSDTIETIIFTDPNYPQEERYELFLYNWEYFNDIKVDNFVFVALSTGQTLSLSINGEELGQSMPITDDYGDDWQYLELSYNTSKKSNVDINELIKRYKDEMSQGDL
jgi:hypothetical protein